MRTLKLDAILDEYGRLILAAPIPLPPGKVRITVDAPADDDADDDDFRSLASAVWGNCLATRAEDVYTVADGVSIEPATGEVARR